MKKKDKRKTRERIVALLMAISTFLGILVIPDVLASTDGADKVAAEFSAVKEEGKEIITITASGKLETVTVKGIELPDGTYVEGTSATFTATKNGEYNFNVHYEEQSEVNVPTDTAAEEEAAANEAPADTAAEEEAAANEARTDTAAEEEAAANEARTDTAAEEEAAANEAPADTAAEEEPTANEAPADTAAEEEAAVNEAPTDTAAEEEAAANEAPADTAAEEEAAANEAPADTAAEEEAAANEAPADTAAEEEPTAGVIGEVNAAQVEGNTGGNVLIQSGTQTFTYKVSAVTPNAVNDTNALTATGYKLYVEDGGTILSGGQGDGKERTCQQGEQVVVAVNWNSASIPKGHTFDKWEVLEGNLVGVDLTQRTLRFEMPAETVRLKAVWRKPTVTVVGGTVAGGSVVEDGDKFLVDASTKYTVTAEPDPPGMRFVKWDDKAGNLGLAPLEAGGRSFTRTMTTLDVEVEAVYKDENGGDYTVTVIDGEGSGLYYAGEVANVYFDTAKTENGVRKKFEGIKVNIEGKESIVELGNGSIPFLVQGNTTITPIYVTPETGQYTLTIINKDTGETIVETQCGVGQKATLEIRLNSRRVEKIEGSDIQFSFDDFNQSIDFIMPNKDVTLEATLNYSVTRGIYMMQDGGAAYDWGQPHSWIDGVEVVIPHWINAGTETRNTGRAKKGSIVKMVLQEALKKDMAKETGVIWEWKVYKADGLTTAKIRDGIGVIETFSDTDQIEFTVGTEPVTVVLFARYPVLKVNEGTFLWNGQSAKEGTIEGAESTYTINITADAAPAGMEFDKWEIIHGKVIITDPESEITTITMDTSADAELTALYKKVADPVDYEVKVVNGGVETQPNTFEESGTFASGAAVTITADTPEEGYRFKEWIVTEGTVTLDDSKAVTTTFEMPKGNVTVKAEYEIDPDYLWTVTVHNGTGGGKYKAGEQVTVTANDAGEGYRFKGWQLSGTAFGEFEKYKNQKKFTFTMPKGNVTVKAEYEIDPDYLWTVTVHNGTGGGKYKAGEQVTVTANDAGEGYRFKGWQLSGTAFGEFEKYKNQKKFTFTMPKGNVKLTAEYEKIPSTGGGGGTETEPPTPGPTTPGPTTPEPPTPEPTPPGPTTPEPPTPEPPTPGTITLPMIIRINVKPIPVDDEKKDDDGPISPIRPIYGVSDEHECCILHFLLMVIAAVVLGWYTKFKKEQQERIHQLKEKLADMRVNQNDALNDEEESSYAI